MRLYRWRPTRDSTLCARLINQTGYLFSLFESVKTDLERLKEIKINKDQKKYLSKKYIILLRKLKTDIVLSILNLRNIIIDAETIFYREFKDIKPIEKDLKKRLKSIESKIDKQYTEQKKENKAELYKRYLKDIHELKETFKEEIRGAAEGAETLETGTTNIHKLQEISLRNTRTVLKKIKRYAIEVFQLNKKAKYNINDMKVIYQLHKEEEDLIEIIEYGYVLLHRIKKDINSIHFPDMEQSYVRQAQREIKKINNYLDKNIEKITTSSRKELHELQRAA